MIIEYIRYEILPEQKEVFEQSYQTAFKPLLASEYCMLAELSQCIEDSNSYILRIEWTSTKEHMEGFRNSSEFKQFLSSIQPYVSNIQEMRHYQCILHKKR